jgi:hypothetical protein
LIITMIILIILHLKKIKSIWKMMKVLMNFLLFKKMNKYILKMFKSDNKLSF